MPATKSATDNNLAFSKNVVSRYARNKINLFSGEAETKLKKLTNRATRVSLAVLFTYVFLLLLLTGLQIFVGGKKAEVNLIQQTLIQDISQLAKQEGLVQVAKNRTTLAKNIISSSPSSPRLLDDVVVALPVSVSVKNAGTEGEGIGVTMQAQDSEAVVTLLEMLKSKQFAAVDLESITLEAGGTYNVAIRVK